MRRPQARVGISITAHIRVTKNAHAQARKGGREGTRSSRAPGSVASDAGRDDERANSDDFFLGPDD